MLRYFVDCGEVEIGYEIQYTYVTLIDLQI